MTNAVSVISHGPILLRGEECGHMNLQYNIYPCTIGTAGASIAEKLARQYIPKANFNEKSETMTITQIGTLQSVQVGTPHRYSIANAVDTTKRSWKTSFFRTPSVQSRWLYTTHLEGNTQADTKNHGQLSQAVLLYAVAHYPPLAGGTRSARDWPRRLRRKLYSGWADRREGVYWRHLRHWRSTDPVSMLENRATLGYRGVDCTCG